MKMKYYEKSHTHNTYWYKWVSKLRNMMISCKEVSKSAHHFLFSSKSRFAIWDFGSSFIWASTPNIPTINAERTHTQNWLFVFSYTYLIHHKTNIHTCHGHAYKYGISSYSSGVSSYISGISLYKYVVINP